MRPTINAAIADCLVRRYVENARTALERPDSMEAFDVRPYYAMRDAVTAGVITGVAADYVRQVESGGFESGEQLLAVLTSRY